LRVEDNLSKNEKVVVAGLLTKNLGWKSVVAFVQYQIGLMVSG
jgi:hypothetical protein